MSKIIQHYLAMLICFGGVVWIVASPLHEKIFPFGLLGILVVGGVLVFANRCRSCRGALACIPVQIGENRVVRIYSPVLLMECPHCGQNILKKKGG